MVSGTVRKIGTKKISKQSEKRLQKGSKMEPKIHQKSSKIVSGPPWLSTGTFWSQKVVPEGGTPPKWMRHRSKSTKKTQTICLKTMLRVRIFRQRTSQRALKNAPDFLAEFWSARAQNRAQILEPDREQKNVVPERHRLSTQMLDTTPEYSLARWRVGAVLL